MDESNKDFGTSEAQNIAYHAHLGQKTKTGKDYVVGHVEPVAKTASRFGEDAEIVAWLHDVVEDSDWTLDRLREAGAPEHVVEAVDAMTRRDGESYMAMITRVCANKLATEVKLADNSCNIMANPKLAQIDADQAFDLLKRYIKARDNLIIAYVRHHRILHD